MGESLWSEIGFLPLYLYYFFVSALMAYIAALFLKPRYRGHGSKIFFFFLLFNQVMPVAGLFFTVWVVWYLLHVRYPKRLHDVQTIHLEEFNLSFPEVKRSFGEGAMLRLFENPDIPSAMKIRALSSLASELSRDHLEIIKLALSDRDDEVRLFCFFVIDKLEKKINEQISVELERFNRADAAETERIEAARQLAMLYWDLVYYALSDEVLENFMVEEAKKFVIYVLKHRYEDIGMHRLLGKIYLYGGEYEKAAREFALAIETDEERSGFIAPYLAEVFYARRNFVSVKALLNSNRDILLNAKLHFVAQMWREAS